MIIASDDTSEGTGMTPVSYGDITFVERLIHTCTLEERVKAAIEWKLYKAEFKEELFEIIEVLKENQKKNLNEELDDALRRAI